MRRSVPKDLVAFFYCAGSFHGPPVSTRTPSLFPCDLGLRFPFRPKIASATTDARFMGPMPKDLVVFFYLAGSFHGPSVSSRTPSLFPCDLGLRFPFRPKIASATTDARFMGPMPKDLVMVFLPRRFFPWASSEHSDSVTFSL